jgi:hypothetical protein
VLVKRMERSGTSTAVFLRHLNGEAKGKSPRTEIPSGLA